MKIGAAIKQVRSKAGLKQKDLAERCGVTAAYLSQIERDVRTPSIELLEKIGSILGIPIPVVLFLGITEDDVASGKVSEFRILKPLVEKLMLDVFEADENSRPENT